MFKINKNLAIPFVPANVKVELEFDRSYNRTEYRSLMFCEK